MKLSTCQLCILLAYSIEDNPKKVSLQLKSASCSRSSLMISGLPQLIATWSGVLPPRSFCVMDPFLSNNLAVYSVSEFSIASCNVYLSANILSTILLTTPNSDSNKWSLINVWLDWKLSHNHLATKYSAKVWCWKTGLESMTSIFMPVFSIPCFTLCTKLPPLFCTSFSSSFSRCCVDKIVSSAAALWLSK